MSPFKKLIAVPLLLVALATATPLLQRDPPVGTIVGDFCEIPDQYACSLDFSEIVSPLSILDLYIDIFENIHTVHDLTTNRNSSLSAATATLGISTMSAN